MRRWIWPAAVGVSAISAFTLLKPLISAPNNADPVKEPPITKVAGASLPITQSVLFSSGVGHFTREGEVEGHARVDLTFPIQDIPDLIKSLTVQDHNGGQVGVVGYDSHDPVDRTLRSYAVNLTGQPSFANILTQLRGEKVEVTLLAGAAAGQPGAITGSIIGVEKQAAAVGKEVVAATVLNLWCVDGARSVKLADVQRVRFLNATIEAEFRKALDTLALSHDAQKKAVSLHFEGKGKRTVSAGYVVEHPIWKTSYRLVLDQPKKGQAQDKPFLQGWAVVDNPSEEDWNEVGVALIAGRPVSFRMDLYQPLYVPRPEERLELFASLRPPTFAGATWSRDRNMAEAEVDGLAKAAPVAPGAPRSGAGKAGFADEKEALKKADSYGQSLQNKMNRRMDLSGTGVQSAATGSNLGDFFQYLIKSPVTLPRQKSALLPIANETAAGQRLSIYNPATHPKFPMLALHFHNATSLHLMQGPVTFFEGSVYAGDAKMPDLPPGDKRLLAYAVDLGTEVDPQSPRGNTRLNRVSIRRGHIITQSTLREEKEYRITNRSQTDRTVWIEHPDRSDFTLVSAKKPVEKASGVQRFEVKVPGSKTETLTVAEEKPLSSSIHLTSASNDTISHFISLDEVTADMKAALREAVSRKDRLARTRQELAAAQARLRDINADQDRLRRNMRETPENSKVYKTYLAKFEKQEEELDALDTKVKALREQELQELQAMEKYLLNLDFETSSKK